MATPQGTHPIHHMELWDGACEINSTLPNNGRRRISRTDLLRIGWDGAVKEETVRPVARLPVEPNEGLGQPNSVSYQAILT